MSVNQGDSVIPKASFSQSALVRWAERLEGFFVTNKQRVVIHRRTNGSAT